MSKEFTSRWASLVSHLLIIITSCSRTPKCSEAGGPGRKITLDCHSCKKHLLLILHISIMLRSLKCYYVYGPYYQI